MGPIAGREICWNAAGRGTLRLLAAAALAAFAYGMYRRWSLWRLGRPAGRSDRLLTRARFAAVTVLGHGRILRGGGSGWRHLPIFWGMAALFAGTVLVALQADFGWNVLHGRFYLGFKLVMDAAGLGVLTGVARSVHRRYIRKAEGIDNRPGDGVALGLLAGIVLTGFFVEALRIASTADPSGPWSPVGNALAALLRGADRGGLEAAHRAAWTAHASLALGWIGTIPYTGMVHLATAPWNVFFRSLAPPGTLAPLDLEDDRVHRFGAGSVRDLTWKDLLDADACVRCDRCQRHCPAWATGKTLSPKKIVAELRVRMAGAGSGAPDASPLVEDAACEDAVWACTTCGSCAERCPVFVEHVPKIVGMRRHRVMMESRFPPELLPVFRNLEQCGNPWGLGRAKRGEWAAGLGIAPIAEGRSPEYLYWAGCAASFDDRNRRVAVAMAGILAHAGVGFGILGPGEACCGDSARRLGNEYLFQSLARRNTETLRRHGVRKIVTSCPHCFHALKHEYAPFGGGFEVVHHTECIAALIEAGRIRPRGGNGGTVAYQDPCYLARHNGVCRPPRDVLEALGYRIAEMRESGREGSCCGAGGGRIWMEERIGERINVRRTGDALAVDPGAVVTACPWCLTMMEDGIKLTDMDRRVRTVDPAELVMEAIREGGTERPVTGPGSAASTAWSG